MKPKRFLVLLGAAVLVVGAGMGVFLLQDSFLTESPYAGSSSATDSEPRIAPPSINKLLAKRFPDLTEDTVALELLQIIDTGERVLNAPLADHVVPGIRKDVRVRRTAFVKRLLSTGSGIANKTQTDADTNADLNVVDVWLAYYGNREEYGVAWYRNKMTAAVAALPEQQQADPLVAVIKSQLSRLNGVPANEEGGAAIAADVSPYLRVLLAREGVLIRKHSPDLKAAEQRLSEAVVAFLASESVATAEFQFVWEIISDARATLSVSGCKGLLIGVLQDESIAPWLVHMLIGEEHRQRAWDQRGGGFASTVSTDGWRGFAEDMPVASLHFRKAWAMRPDIPYSAQRMIMISKSHGDRLKSRDWFDLAVQAEFDLHRNYSAYLHTLRPRWGGSIREMLDFGFECANTRDFPSEVANQLYTAIECVVEEFDIEDTGGGDHQIQGLFTQPSLQQELREHWSALRTAIEAGQYSRPERIADAMAWHAACAMQMNDAKELAAAIWSDEYGKSLSGFRQLFPRGDVARSKAYAMVSEHAKAVQELEKRTEAMRDGHADVAEIQKALTAVSDLRSKLSEPSQLYLASHEVTLQRLLKYHSEEWVPLEFRKDMLGWKVSGEFAYQSASAVEVSRKHGSATAMVDCRTPFPLPYEVIATVERIRGTPTLDAIGIDLGTTNHPAVAAGCFVCALSVPMGGGVCSRYPEFKDSYEIPGTDDVTEIKVRVWKYHYEAQWDGVTLPIPVHRGFRGGDRLAFGGSTILDDYGTVRISNIRIHKIPERPTTALRVSPEVHADYLTRLIEIDPEDRPLKTRLAAIRATQFRWSEARRLLSESQTGGQYRWDAWPVIAEVELGCGNCSKAKEIYGELVKSEPQNVVFKNAFAWICATSPESADRDGAQALQLAQQLVSQRSRNYKYRITLSAALAESGDIEGAKRELQAAKELSSDEHAEAISRFETQLDSKGVLRHQATPDADEAAVGESKNQ